MSLSSREEHITDENVTFLWAQSCSEVKRQRHLDTLLERGFGPIKSLCYQNQAAVCIELVEQCITSDRLLM